MACRHYDSGERWCVVVVDWLATSSDYRETFILDMERNLGAGEPESHDVFRVSQRSMIAIHCDWRGQVPVS